jgi:hypothetical protein
MARQDKITPENIAQNIDAKAPERGGVGYSIWTILVDRGLNVAALAKALGVRYETAKKLLLVEKEKRRKQKADRQEALDTLNRL